MTSYRALRFTLFLLLSQFIIIPFSQDIYLLFRYLGLCPLEKRSTAAGSTWPWFVAPRRVGESACNERLLNGFMNEGWLSSGRTVLEYKGLEFIELLQEKHLKML